jgi:hypothetical protein
VNSGLVFSLELKKMAKPSCLWSGHESIMARIASHILLKGSPFCQLVEGLIILPKGSPATGSELESKGAVY